MFFYQRGKQFHFLFNFLGDSRKLSTKGFTLIELMIAFAIIAMTLSLDTSSTLPRPLQ